MRLVREFSRGSASSLLLIGIGLGLTFVAQVVLARWLSTEDYGIFRYVVNVETILVLFAQVGLPQILIREIAGAASRGESAAAHILGCVRASRWIYGVSGLVFVAIAAGVLWLLRGHVDEKLLLGLSFLLVLLPIDLFAGNSYAALRGLKRVAFGLMGDNVAIPGAVMIFALLFWLFGLEGIVPALVAQVLAVLASLALGATLLRRWLGERPPVTRPLKTRIRELLSNSLPLALANPLFQLSRYLDVLILGIFAPMSEVALYAVASRVATLGALGLRATAPITGPLVAERFAQGDLRGVERTAFMAAAISTAYAGAFIVLLLFAGHLVLGLFGNEYPQAYPLLLVVSAGYLVNAIVGSVNQLLVMTKHQGTYLRILVVCTAVNLVLNLALIPYFGAFGAAYATLIANLLLCASSAVAVRRLLRINSSVFNWRLISEIEFSRAGRRAMFEAIFARKGARSRGGPAVAEES
jgi:O-antigen/teichoic acid export membrane protein